MRERTETGLDERTAVRADFAHLILDVLETAEDKVEAVRTICKGFTGERKEPEPTGPDYKSLMQ